MFLQWLIGRKSKGKEGPREDAPSGISEHQPHPAQRKRILPAWMLAEDLSGQNLAAPVKGGGRFLFLLMLSFKEALKSIKKFL